MNTPATPTYTQIEGNWARIRAKRILHNLFKQIAAASDIILSDVYGYIDQIIDDTITAAVDQVGCMRPRDPEIYTTPPDVAAVIANPAVGTGGFMSVPHDESGEDGTR